MKIAIIEKGHFEVAYTLISLFDKSDNQLTIFIDEESCHQLAFLLQEKIEKYEWVIQQKEKNRDFIKSIFKKINNGSFDLVYFSTIADNFIHYASEIKKLKEEKVVLTLHDINGFFRYTPTFNFRKLVRYIGKRKLISTVPAFNVLSETLIPFLNQKLNGAKKIFNIPGAFFEPEKFRPVKYAQGNSINITIPGSIDNRRRDYTQVFTLLNKAAEIKINVAVTLLGAFRENRSEDIKAQSLQYLQQNNNLHIYNDSIVCQDEFDKIMSETHFIWMPLQQFAIVTDGAKEEYGATISSGNVGDVIRHAKPFFVPAYFTTDAALEKSRISYNDVPGIIGILKEMNSEKFEQLQHEAFNASMHYTKEKIIERNKSLFE